MSDAGSEFGALRLLGILHEDRRHTRTTGAYTAVFSDDSNMDYDTPEEVVRATVLVGLTEGGQDGLRAVYAIGGADAVYAALSAIMAGMLQDGPGVVG